MLNAMNEEEKKDNSDPNINYRTDWAETHAVRKEAANEKSNQARGQKLERVRDAEGGKIKSVETHLIEGEERKEKTMAERVSKAEPIQSKKPIKDLHLKSTSALTDPETAKQNIKGADKARNFGKKTSPARGGFRGGAPMFNEPNEIIKEKHKPVNPGDILSKKSKEKPFLLAMNDEKKPVITNHEQKQKPHQQFKEEPKSQHKAAQENLEQKQKAQSKSFKPAPAKDIFDTLPEKSNKKSGVNFEPAAPKNVFDTLPEKTEASKTFKVEPQKDALTSKSAPQKSARKSETPTPTPTNTVRRSKPAVTGKIKR